MSGAQFKRQVIELETDFGLVRIVPQSAVFSYSQFSALTDFFKGGGRLEVAKAVRPSIPPTPPPEKGPAHEAFVQSMAGKIEVPPHLFTWQLPDGSILCSGGAPLLSFSPRAVAAFVAAIGTLEGDVVPYEEGLEDAEKQGADPRPGGTLGDGNDRETVRGSAPAPQSAPEAEPAKVVPIRPSPAAVAAEPDKSKDKVAPTAAPKAEAKPESAGDRRERMALEEKLTIREIAEREGVSDGAVHLVLTARGLVRHKGRFYRPDDVPQEDALPSEKEPEKPAPDPEKVKAGLRAAHERRQADEARQAKPVARPMVISTAKPMGGKVDRAISKAIHRAAELFLMTPGKVICPPIGEAGAHRVAIWACSMAGIEPEGLEIKFKTTADNARVAARKVTELLNKPGIDPTYVGRCEKLLAEVREVMK